MSVKSFKTSGVGVDLAPQGLVLINTTSFSGVASFSLPANTFNATYKSYRLVWYISNSIDSTIVNMRFRASGSDDTAANYYGNKISMTFTGTTVTGLNTNGATSFPIGEYETLEFTNIMDINNIFIATRANLFGNAYGAGKWQSYGFQHASSVSYDSATIFPASGNITGSVSVYGYNK
jgi:hypothetical protein